MTSRKPILSSQAANLASVPVLLIAVIVQSAIVPYFRIGGGGPDFILMIVLSWMLLAGIEEGALWAIIGGILQDLSNRSPLGLSALALVLVTSGAQFALGQVSRGNLIIPLVAIMVVTPIYHVVLVVLYLVSGQSVDIGYTLMYVTLPTVGFNAVLIVIVFRLLGRLYTSTRPRGISM